MDSTAYIFLPKGLGRWVENMLSPEDLRSGLCFWPRAKALRQKHSPQAIPQVKECSPPIDLNTQEEIFHISALGLRMIGGEHAFT